MPEEQFAWAPHRKSSTLGKLANHLAVMPAFVAMIVYGKGKRPVEAQSKAELVALLEANVGAGHTALAHVSDEHLLTRVPVRPDQSMTRV